MVFMYAQAKKIPSVIQVMICDSVMISPLSGVV